MSCLSHKTSKLRKYLSHLHRLIVILYINGLATMADGKGLGETGGACPLTRQHLTAHHVDSTWTMCPAM
jgi:hypothetical protein